MDFKRSVDEMIAIYDLEESVRDVYVEGTIDKSFFQWIIGSESISEVYSVNDISIPDELLEKYNLVAGSNRNKIVAVSTAIAEALPNNKNAIFIVDRDFSEYIQRDLGSHSLRYTDYNSIELYALNENVIRKLMALVYGRYSASLPNFYPDMKRILKQVYAIRLTSIELKWNMSWLEFNRYVKVNQSIEFNQDKFIEAYLQKNSRWSKRDEFYSAFNKLHDNLNSDCRLSSRGHDFTELLMHILNKKIPSRKMDKIDIFEGFLIGLLEKVDLLSENLIKEIYMFSRCS